MTDDEFFWLGDALETKSYRYAKTMPKHPHWYSMRQEWNQDDDFVRAVKLIRRHGYDRRFYAKSYRTFNLNEYYYWTMGEPIDKDGKPWTYILNRAKRTLEGDYDRIALGYDELFNDDESLAENKSVMDAIGWTRGESTLDIGCGTGLFLEYNDCTDYLGVDPSCVMLSRLGDKFPQASVMHSDFEHFYTGRKFDLVISTFGSCSYIEPSTIGRIRRYIADGGRMFLMFYGDGYRPVTYDKTGIEVRHHNVSEYLDRLGDVSVEKYHEFVIVTC